MEGFAPVGAIWHERGLVDVLELRLGRAPMSHLAGFACRQVAGKGSTWCFQREGNKKALGSALQSLCCVLESLFFSYAGLVQTLSCNPCPAIYCSGGQECQMQGLLSALHRDNPLNWGSGFKSELRTYFCPLYRPHWGRIFFGLGRLG